MNKKLSMSTLKQLDSKNYTQKKIIVQDCEILIDEQFRQTKVQRLLAELADKQSFFEANSLDMNMVDYMTFLMIRYFTSLEEIIPDDFSKQIQVFNLLVDNGFYTKIMEAFDQAEFKKISDTLKNQTDNLNNYLDNISHDPNAIIQ